MSDFYMPKKDDRISFQQIVLKHFQKILEISCCEFTGGYWNYIYSGNITNKSYVTDKRAEFSQAVEMLAAALAPRFDKEMDEDFEKIEEEEGKIKKGFLDSDGLIKKENNAKIKYSVKKLELMKKLFKALSKLLHRLDYFKSTFYTEGPDDDFDFNEDD
jgi:hypothetical protein